MRVVSLCPSLTELVFDLGSGAELVGVTRFCVHPSPAVDAVERVGGTKDPDVARIVALRPDLVLMNDEENRREDYEALRAAEITCLSSMPRDIADTARTVVAVGKAIGRSERGAELARDIVELGDEVRSAANGEPARSFAYLIWRKPWMVAGGDTFIDSLLTNAGGQNVFAQHADRYPRITAEDLSRLRPDRVLLSSEPFPFSSEHVDELSRETGLPSDRFRIVDGELLSWHGSRTRYGIPYARSCIADHVPR